MNLRLRKVWKNHRGLVLAFGLAAAVTVFFAVRSVVFAIYWADPGHRFQPIEAWMTPRYIAYSYDLDPQQVADLLGITGTQPFRPTLTRLAKEQGVPVSALIAALTRQLPRPGNRP